MAIKTGPVPSGDYQDSIARVEIFTEAKTPQEDWRVVVWFENGPYDAQGNLTGGTVFGSTSVQRRVGDIIGEAGIADLMTQIKTKGYQWYTEDKEREAEAKASAEAAAAQKLAENTAG